MHTTSAKHIYFVGIGGAGMSSLAQLLHARGIQVSGSDKDESSTLAMLREKGITTHIGHSADTIPKNTEILIYSDAVHEDMPERVYAKENGIPQKSYFEALGEVSEDYITIAVAGTHGKTTTTAMLARMLEHLDPTVVVGSVMRDTGSNVRIGKSKYLIVEACEYKDHFLHLSPTYAVITNIELDHTDYFKDIDALVASYVAFVKKIPTDGALVLSKTLAHKDTLIQEAASPVYEYDDTEIPTLCVPGEFNKENAKGALTLALHVDSHKKDAYHEALATFPGTWRRFEYKGSTTKGALIYDDYAHHPTAIEKTLTAAREHFPSKKIVVAFHPHLYSRTRDFMDGFAAALSRADHVYVLPIFPAREVFDGETTNEKLVEEIIKKGGVADSLTTKEDFEEALSLYGDDTLFFTMGAGNIYTWIPASISTTKE